MGNALNPPDSKKKLRRTLRGEKAVNHRVEVLYASENGCESWERGTIIMYSKSKGYLVTFDNRAGLRMMPGRRRSGMLIFALLTNSF